jgi:hypothetical protein
VTDMLQEGGKGCVALESGISEIYRCFSRMFPESKDFWSDLAMEEENHAAILAVALEYEKRGKVPVLLISCSGSQIAETLQLLRTARKRIEGGNLSLKAALEMALQLETATRQYHLFEVTARETNSVILAGLQSLAIDNEWHIQKIGSFLSGRVSS